MRKGYNFKHLIEKWDEIVMRLCEEVTPHDVLSVVKDYLKVVAADFDKVGLDPDRFNKAVELLDQALAHINPTEEEAQQHEHATKA
jgi:hypothetical protein